MQRPHLSNPKRLTATLIAGVFVLAACGDDSSAPADTNTSATTATPPATEADTTSTAPPPTDTDAAAAGPDADVVQLVTYESFDTSEGSALAAAFEEFTAKTGVEVEHVVSGDTGTMLSKAVLTAGNPEGDVMWGVDNTYLSRAVAEDVFEPYEADGLDAIPARFTDLVPGHEATPVDFGDVCVNYDVAALDDAGVEPPETLADLAAPEYADMLVVTNPASSSPGLAFLMASIAEYGDGWTDYWQQLDDNGVMVVDGWSEAYYEAFSFAGGDRPLVVSYGSSPPFEVLYSEEELDAAPTGVAEGTCFRQVEFAGVLAGTDAPQSARLLVDFLISERFQRDVALNLFVFPTNENVELEPEFADYAVIADEPYSLPGDTIDANREDWIDTWNSIVLS